ncbi:MAG: hypothetical protein QNJ54_16525 [Prochloraceae cyanobacterium]|nr:hypothetical protein [Prochloraceae cyanobacterium]
MMLTIGSKIALTVLLMGSSGAIDTSILQGRSSPNRKDDRSAAKMTKINSSVNSLTGFVMPSRNIYCALIGEKQEYLRCEIRSGLNPMPPRPESCESDWGAGFLLSRQSSAEILCISDTIIRDDYPTFAYGSNWMNAGFECESQKIGLTCKNSRGQGFFLSREQWYRFSIGKNKKHFISIPPEG